MVIKKEMLNDDQIKLIRAYKDILIPAGSYVEEYTAGFKFYIEDSDRDKISEFFKVFGIFTIDAAFFNEEWTY